MRYLFLVSLKCQRAFVPCLARALFIFKGLNNAQQFTALADLTVESVLKVSVAGRLLSRIRSTYTASTERTRFFLDALGLSDDQPTCLELRNFISELLCLLLISRFAVPFELVVRCLHSLRNIPAPDLDLGERGNIAAAWSWSWMIYVTLCGSVNMFVVLTVDVFVHGASAVHLYILGFIIEVAMVVATIGCHRFNRFFEN
jgi:hypothetical protein